MSDMDGEGEGEGEGGASVSGSQLSQSLSATMKHLAEVILSTKMSVIRGRFVLYLLL